MPERKVNPKLVALALARGATQVEAYREGGGGTDHDGVASTYCQREDVARYRAYYELDEMDRLKAGLRLADDHAAAVLAGEEPGVTCRDKADARGYFAQRERTHTAISVEIGHRIEFKGLRPADTGDRDVLEVASLASQERIDAPKDAPTVPALPASTGAPLVMGDTPSPSEASQVRARLEDTAG